MFTEIPAEAPPDQLTKPSGTAGAIVRDQLRMIRDAGGLERRGTRFYRYNLPITHLVARRLEGMGLLEWTQSSGDMRLGLLTAAGQRAAK